MGIPRVRLRVGNVCHSRSHRAESDRHQSRPIERRFHECIGAASSDDVSARLPRRRIVHHKRHTGGEIQKRSLPRSWSVQCVRTYPTSACRTTTIERTVSSSRQACIARRGQAQKGLHVIGLHASFLWGLTAEADSDETPLDGAQPCAGGSAVGACWMLKVPGSI